MKWSAVPFAVITVLVFCAPVKTISSINVAWVLGFLILFYFFMTCYCTPYNALISEFGKTQEDRMYISTAISFTYFFGMILSYLPFVLAGPLRNVVSYSWSYRICFILLTAIALVCLLLPTFLLDETAIVDSKPSDTDMFRSLGATFKNKEFRLFVGSDFSYWIGLTLFQTGLPYFVKVSMGLDESLTMILLGAMSLLSVFFYPVVYKLVSKFGKKKLTIAGFLGLAFAYLVTALIGVIPLPGMVFGVAIVVIAAFPMALLGIIPQAIVADIAEEDSITTGEDRQGMFFAARTFAMKFGASAAMLIFTSLAIIGSPHTNNTNEIVATETGLRIVAIVAVCACSLGALLLAFYNEKKVMKTIGEKQKQN